MKNIEKKQSNISQNRIKKFYNLFKTKVEDLNSMLISNEKEYINAHSKLKVKCNNNHLFEISYNNLKSKRWCNLCSINKSEKYTKACLEILLNKSFKKYKPNWLLNSRGNKMELDMYNEELKLACEYNGIQHYKYIQFFYKNEKEFLFRQESDKLKEKLCKENGVTLIIVPYNKNIIETLKEKLIKLNLSFNEITSSVIIQNETKNKLITIVELKEGSILSDKELIYFRSDKIHLKCNKNHNWTTTVQKILNGSWCHTCCLEVQLETKRKISMSLKDYYSKEKGKNNKTQSHNKRSETMIQIKKERIENLVKVNEKKCSKCNIIKSLDFFCKKKASQDGYQSWCLKCINIRKTELKLLKNKMYLLDTQEQ